MCSIYWIWKPIGWSPKRCADSLANMEYFKNAILRDPKVSISFAARLDPMAYGIMPIVMANKHDIARICNSLQSGYKTYRFNVISGVTTDSHDILGISTLFDGVPETIPTIIEKKTQLYPIYSSRTVPDPDTGKMEKMFNLTKAGKTVVRPEHPVDIKYIKALRATTVRSGELWAIISKRLGMLMETGFRLDDIRAGWIDLLFKMYNGYFQTDESKEWEITTYEAHVGPGTYIRCIANDLGGTAYDICRVESRSEEYTSPDAKGLTDITNKFIVL